MSTSCSLKDFMRQVKEEDVLKKGEEGYVAKTEAEIKEEAGKRLKSYKDKNGIE